MEALGQLLTAILTFIFEVTIHALVFIFYLLMAVFSPRYRDKLQDEWNTSAWKRFSIGLGITFYSAALIFALVFWTAALPKRTSEIADSDKTPTVTIDFSNGETQQLKNTKEIHELVNAAAVSSNENWTNEEKQQTRRASSRPSAPFRIPKEKPKPMAPKPDPGSGCHPKALLRKTKCSQPSPAGSSGESSATDV